VGSDRARISYDPSRHWRGVISQQGRVTLEADQNEADAIAAHERRQELLDIVGPLGTPDSGYQILPGGSGNPPGDLTIQHGTLYVGGERMVLDSDLDYAEQTDWIDIAGDPLWTAPAVPTSGTTEAIYLLLRAQEVGAVEDPALLDVALGGPDTAARWRILQRVVRTPTNATDCPGAMTALEQLWAANGLQLDPATLRLESLARLRVSFQQQPQAPSLCEPSGQGGYLVAQNQLIRVQVASVDNGIPTLVWGFDNASFLYRIAGTPVVNTTAGTTTVTLATAPVDSYHGPAQNQAVEVLMAAAQVTGIDYIAAATGVVSSVTVGYNADTKQLELGTVLDANVLSSPLLFLRVWQDTVVYSSPGPVALGDTGIQVSLSTTGSTYNVGDYWTFAVRPGTPTTVSPVYPERIQDALQPPDGQPMWACLLGLVTWTNGTPAITNCVPSFGNLVTLTERGSGCCTVEVGPADVDDGASLQKLIDDNSQGVPATICLRPGRYILPSPLMIGALAQLTIQACEEGVVLAPASAGTQFLLGLVVVAEDTTDLTLRGLELELEPVPFEVSAAAIDGLPAGHKSLLSSYVRGARALGAAIGVGLLGGGMNISIEQCTFNFPRQIQANLFAAAIFATGTVNGLTVADCTFAAIEPETLPFSDLRLGNPVPPPYQLLYGYLQVPSQAQQVADAQPAAAEPGAAGTGSAATPTVQASEVVPVLEDATFTRNVFTGQTVPILVVGELGTVWVRDVTVRASYGGFWFLAADSAALTMLDRLDASDAAVTTFVQSNNLLSLADPALWLALAIGRLLPATPPSEQSQAVIVGAFQPSQATLQGAAHLLGVLTAQAPATDSATVPDQAAPETSQAAPETESVSEPASPAGAATAEDSPAGTPPAEAVVNAPGLPAQVQNIFAFDPTAAVTTAPPIDTGVSATPRLDIHACQVDAIVRDSDSGVGLLIALLASTPGPSSALCTGNRIRSRVKSGATVGLYQLLECAMTGNIISNEIESSGLAPVNLSLVLAPTPVTPVGTKIELWAVAVTGNVLIGDEPAWPGRPLLPPLSTWDPLNTVMSYLPALE
jgi:hypothetical protein